MPLGNSDEVNMPCRRAWAERRCSTVENQCESMITIVSGWSRSNTSSAKADQTGDQADLLSVVDLEPGCLIEHDCGGMADQAGTDDLAHRVPPRVVRYLTNSTAAGLHSAMRRAPSAVAVTRRRSLAISRRSSWARSAVNLAS